MASACVLPMPVGCGQDSLGQLLSSLSALENLVSEVFSTINDRVSEEKRRLESLGDRLYTQQKKIGQLSQCSTDAICVMSPATYPAPAVLESCRPLFDTFDRCEPRSPIIRGPVYPTRPASKALALSIENEAMLSFGESSYKAKERQISKSADRIDSSARSCADLVLFNSMNSPYLKAESERCGSNLESLVYASAKRMENLAARSTKISPMALPPPPPSLLSGDIMPSENEWRVRFRPRPERLVTSFPLDLPQLRNVATNVVCDTLPDFAEEDFFPNPLAGAAPGLRPSELEDPADPSNFPAIDLPTFDEVEHVAPVVEVRAQAIEEYTSGLRPEEQAPVKEEEREKEREGDFSVPQRRSLHVTEHTSTEDTFAIIRRGVELRPTGRLPELVPTTSPRPQREEETTADRALVEQPDMLQSAQERDEPNNLVDVPVVQEPAAEQASSYQEDQGNVEAEDSEDWRTDDGAGITTPKQDDVDPDVPVMQLLREKLFYIRQHTG